MTSAERPSAWLILLAVLALAGCVFAQRDSRPAQLYVLTPIPPSGSYPERGARGPAIWVGPITLPQYTNRPQIVTGNTGPELRRAFSAVWAEPLQDNVARVLAENLSLLLSSDRVAIFPWTSPVPLDYQITVDVTNFLGEPGGEVSLTALWKVLGKNGKEVLASKKSTFTQASKSKDYDGFVSAMSQNLASLSREIAAAISQLPQQDGPPQAK
ncbi:MAG TPA: PqiC family protein [Candidatus Acidoferrales bacterium]|nr:PqiC family protein [Candidatus Acidoferrales bacterium]